MINSESKNIKVKATNLTKRFEMLETTSNKMKTLFGLNRNKGQEFWALRNVSFEVHDGETIGIIGLNGSGKSTISTLISESMTPTTGTLEVNGEVSIIALGTGLIPNLTGRENIHVVGLMMGMTKKEIADKLDDIISFSELGPFIDQPLKTYSSGMRAKLSFSIAAYQDPDILIIDEVLSVGDGTFGQKSADKMFEFREQGKTILLISHDMVAIEKWCDKVLWLHYGEVKAYGPTKEVLPQYINFVQWFIHLKPEEQDEYKQRVRDEQLTYTVEQLREEIVDEHGEATSRTIRTKIDEQLNSIKNNKLSIFSKGLLIVLATICILGALYYTSSAQSPKALADPVYFFRHQAFSTNTSFSKQISSQLASKAEEVRENATEKGNQISQTGKTTTDKPDASKKKTAISKSTSEVIATSTYTVQEGDTLGEIARTSGISLEELQAANPDITENAIYVGEVLKIPKVQNQNTDNTTADATTEGQ
ncbi:ATP-binding cassette domain-containing protein [Lactococcus lactis]|uniref:ATP-binding cassette domain-containing protein n=1 Tax=Lactococcus lactis TaxID=1358 RepID=UPI002073EDEB|nr:ATP-binding cassette domain-containing protein [Lactococcus lactis]